MTAVDEHDPAAASDPLRRATIALRVLKDRAEGLERAAREPIAIVGMSCRFPGGANDPESFWSVLDRGIDTIGDARVRFPGAAAQLPPATHWAGLLDNVDGFDPQFFGITPREAVKLDPQQRLLLEVGWEAIEDAGIAAESLAGSATGVFVGVMNHDYQHLLSSAAQLDVYDYTGGFLGYTAGRLSYVLGLQGPCFALNTGCSSSLVAVHQACQSLRNGESNLALAGGVNLILSAETMRSFGALPLSPDGRCKSFDADANGFVRGEGCGVVVLKRLSDAQRDQDRIHAVVLGSAMNHDGHSMGLTAPSLLAQRDMLRQAFKNAQVSPADLSFIETHGTGTALGDPIEVEALKEVFAEGRASDSKCLLGAVKSNVGHLEAAAGMAGLFKVVLALEHEKIPRNLHFRALNPHISLEDTPFVLATSEQPWPRGGAPRRAGLSAFALTGTNAHLVLEEAPAPMPTTASPVERPVHVLPLSGKSEVALREQARRYGAHLSAHPQQSFADVCHTAGVGRSHLEERLAVVARTSAEAQAKLVAFVAGEDVAGCVRGRFEEARRPKVAFLFTGQGSQYAGMGRELYETQPVFRAALDRCAEILAPELGQPLLSVMWGEAGCEGLLDETTYTQPALFALEYALSELWQSFGIKPEAVLGHSVGEYVAACVAGVLSLEDGLKLIATRGRLMGALARDGAMASVRANAARVEQAVSSYGTDVSVAAYNEPEQVVISGRREAVEKLCAELGRQGVKTKGLQVSHAFHSVLMEPMLDELERVASGMTLGAPRLTLISNVTGQRATSEVATGGYWRRHAREAVHFTAGIETLRTMGVDTFVEVGPQPVLSGMGASSVSEETVGWLPSLREGRGPWDVVQESLGRLYVRGAQVDFRGVDAPYSRRRVTLPTYAFQRQRYWVEGAVQLPRVDIREHLYVPAWRHKPLAANAQVEATGPWLVVGTGGQVGERLVTALQRAGAKCTWLREGFAGGIAQALAHGAVRDLVYLWKPEGTPEGAGNDAGNAADAACRRGIADVVHGVQAMLGAEQRLPRLWLVTQGAMSTGSEDAEVSPEQAALWGLGRVVSLEHPDAWGCLVDLPAPPAQLDESIIASLTAQLLASDGEDHVAVRSSGRYVQRLIRHQPTAAGSWSTRGTALVTGGLGALGLHVAKWLASRGVEHLVLTSRRGSAAPGAASAVATLAALGVKVTLAQGDASDEKAMAAVLADIQRRLPPLTTVFHAAGIIDDAPVASLDDTRLGRTMDSKVNGTVVLHKLTREMPLEAFVCFSSIAGAWGAGGQPAYAAANAFQDAWIKRRRAQGRVGLSVNWGPWLGGGMATDEELVALSRRGVEGLAPELALQALALAMSGDAPQVIAAQVDWPRFSAVYESRRRRPLLAEVAVVAETTVDVPDASFLSELRAAPVDEQRGLLQRWLQSQVARSMGLDNPSLVSPSLGFRDQGMDSLMVVELQNALKKGLGIKIAVNDIFDHPRVEALAKFLLSRLAPPAAAKAAETPAVPRERTAPQITAAMLDGMSEDEKAALLEKALAEVSEHLS